jgi:20S proteasome alpha/beta subunit
MTAIIGILCADGVVIGTDSATTFGVPPHVRTIETPSKKIALIHSRVIVAGTGEVGLNQRFCEVVRKMSDEKKFTGSATNISVGTAVARNALIEFELTGIRSPNIQYGSLLAFPLGHECYLCEFAFGTFQPEFKSKELWFASMGSGQAITDPFLGFLRKIFWPREKGQLPSIKEGLLFATWALSHVIELNTGGVNGPIQLAILERSKKGVEARECTDDKLQEHASVVRSAEEHLRKFTDAFSSRQINAAPTLPELGS